MSCYPFNSQHKTSHYLSSCCELRRVDLKVDEFYTSSKILSNADKIIGMRSTPKGRSKSR